MFWDGPKPEKTGKYLWFFLFSHYLNVIAWNNDIVEKNNDMIEKDKKTSETSI